MNEKELLEIEQGLRSKIQEEWPTWEQIEQLIAEVRRLKDELESWQGLAHDRLKNWCMFFDRSSKLEKENKRYKQALKFYADSNNYSSATAHNGQDVIADNGEIANIALEVDTNEKTSNE